MLDNILLIIGNVLTVVGGLGAITFTVSYGAFFSWRKTEAGRSLFYVFASIDLLFINNALGSLLGVDYPGRNIVRDTILTLVAFTVWRLVFVLWHNWRRGDPHPLDIEPRPREMKEKK